MSSEQPAAGAAKSKGRGRPAGSKNKPKPAVGDNPFEIARRQQGAAAAAAGVTDTGAACQTAGASAGVEAGSGGVAAGVAAAAAGGLAAGGLRTGEVQGDGTPLTGDDGIAVARTAIDPGTEGLRSPAQLAFFATVRKEVDSKIGLAGHGDKSGKLTTSYVFDTFWFKPADPVLQRQPSPPEAFYAKKVFLVCWEYTRQVKKPCCSKCESDEHVTREGWDPMGRIVYGEHGNYYLIGFQYKCSSCGHTFAPWDPVTVSLLPRELQEMFPCVVLARSAVDKRVLRMLEPQLVLGKGFKTVESTLTENYMHQYHSSESSYYFHIDRRRKQLAHGELLLFGAQKQLLSSPQQFSKFDDRGGYDGSVPSDTLLEAAWFLTFEIREHWYHRRQQLIGGLVLSGDAAHKLVKGVRLLNANVVYGVFTVLNEWNQVVLQRPLLQDAVGSIAELERDLERLSERYEMMGFPNVQVWYSDNCCSDRPVIQRAFKLHNTANTQAAASAVVAHARTPTVALAFPTDAACSRILTSSANMQYVDKACASLIDSARSAAATHGLSPFLGVRVIWDSSVVGKPAALAVLVASIDGTAVCFHTKSTQHVCVPASLADLLQNSAVLKVGFTITTDAQYLRECAGIRMAPLEHLPALALRVLPTCANNGTAVGLTVSTIGCLLPKEPGASWTAAGIPQSVVSDACLVPYSACWVYRRIMAHADPICRPGPSKADLPSGQQVRLYGKTNTVCVAEGIVQEYTAEHWGTTSLFLNPVDPQGDGVAAAAKRRVHAQAVAQAHKHVVVRITNILIPNALSRNVCEDGLRRELRAIGVGHLALWDVVSNA